jgi:hypothetical protein
MYGLTSLCASHRLCACKDAPAFPVTTGLLRRRKHFAAATLAGAARGRLAAAGDTHVFACEETALPSCMITSFANRNFKLPKE